MTMVVDNNFKKYDNAALVLLPFQYFNDNFHTIIETLYIKNYSIIFISDTNSINALDKIYKHLNVPSYSYKIIIQLNSSYKHQIISNEKSNYKYIQLINFN